jgi:hypothetical protein
VLALHRSLLGHSCAPRANAVLFGTQVRRRPLAELLAATSSQAAGMSLHQLQVLARSMSRLQCNGRDAWRALDSVAACATQLIQSRYASPDAASVARQATSSAVARCTDHGQNGRSSLPEPGLVRCQQYNTHDAVDNSAQGSPGPAAATQPTTPQRESLSHLMSGGGRAPHFLAPGASSTGGAVEDSAGHGTEQPVACAKHADIARSSHGSKAEFLCALGSDAAAWSVALGSTPQAPAMVDDGTKAGACRPDSLSALMSNKDTGSDFVAPARLNGACDAEAGQVGDGHQADVRTGRDKVVKDECCAAVDAQAMARLYSSDGTAERNPVGASSSACASPALSHGDRSAASSGVRHIAQSNGPVVSDQDEASAEAEAQLAARQLYGLESKATCHNKGPEDVSTCTPQQRADAGDIALLLHAYAKVGHRSPAVRFCSPAPRGCGILWTELACAR